MKPAHKLLFVLCPMLVLGFIYYSSGKLHLHVWGQKPHKGVAATVKVSKVTKNTVKSPVTKEPVVEGPVSVGRIVGSVFDKQGFLLNLETKLPPELVYKYGNLSEGSCKPGYAAAKMTAIYPNFFKPAFDLQGFAILSSLSSSDLSTNSVNGGPLC